MAIYQIAVKARSLGGNDFRNIHHYDSGANVLTPSERQEAVNTIDNDYKTNLQGWLHSSIEFYAYDFRRVDLPNQPTIEVVPTAGTWLGTDASNKLPEQVAALVTMKAETTFPRTTRTYLFGFGESANSVGGGIEANALLAINAWAADVVQLVLVGPINLDKCSVKYGGTPPAVVDSNVVSPSPAPTIFATQRRRRFGA